jgi:nitrogen fixation-related uncharacterized protein
MQNLTNIEVFYAIMGIYILLIVIMIGMTYYWAVKMKYFKQKD